MEILSDHIRPPSCCMTDQSKEASFVISALSVNALTEKAEITHWRIDGQSGDDGGSFLCMIRPSVCARPNQLLCQLWYNNTFRILYNTSRASGRILSRSCIQDPRSCKVFCDYRVRRKNGAILCILEHLVTLLI